jgi:hypothetical protein
MHIEFARFVERNYSNGSIPAIAHDVGGRHPQAFLPGVREGINTVLINHRQSRLDHWMVVEPFVAQLFSHQPRLPVLHTADRDSLLPKMRWSAAFSLMPSRNRFPTSIWKAPKTTILAAIGTSTSFWTINWSVCGLG